MSRIFSTGFGLVVALALAGCGGDEQAAEAPRSAPETRPSDPAAAAEDQPTPEPEPSEEPEPEPTGADRFEGVHRNNYEQAETVCGSFPPEQVASDLGVNSEDPEDIADAYARDYRPAFREAVYQGCLAGLR